jgi:putative transposase
LISASSAPCLKVCELQDENRRLKKMYAEAQLSADLLKEAMSKEW